MKGNSITISRTEGGIPVVTEFIPGCESAGYMVAVGTGSRDENPEIFGLSHLLEHVVFRETKTRTSYQMAKEMEGAGGELNAFTGRELTAFYGVTIKETKDVAKEMVSDIFSNPLINDEDVELEKKIVLQELSMIENEPEARIHDLFPNTIWRGHQLSQDEGGLPSVVEGLGAPELREYYDERYGIPNMAVFSAGNVDSEDTVAWASEKFDGMTGKMKIKRQPPKVPDSAYAFVKNKSEHCHIGFGLPAYDSRSENRMPAMLLGSILGSGTSSRLFQDVRESKALVYSVHTATEQYSDASSMTAYMSSTDGNVIKALEATASVFSRLKREGLEKNELAGTKRLLKGALVRSMESTERRLYRLSGSYMLNGSSMTLEQRLEAIEAVTEDQVMRVAQDLIKQSSLNIVVLGKGNKAIRDFDISSLDL